MAPTRRGSRRRRRSVRSVVRSTWTTNPSREKVDRPARRPITHMSMSEARCASPRAQLPARTTARAPRAASRRIRSSNTAFARSWSATVAGGLTSRQGRIASVPAPGPDRRTDLARRRRGRRSLTYRRRQAGRSRRGGEPPPHLSSRIERFCTTRPDAQLHRPLLCTGRGLPARYRGPTPGDRRALLPGRDARPRLRMGHRRAVPGDPLEGPRGPQGHGGQLPGRDRARGVRLRRADPLAAPPATQRAHTPRLLRGPPPPGFHWNSALPALVRGVDRIALERRPNGRGNLFLHSISIIERHHDRTSPRDEGVGLRLREAVEQREAGASVRS